MCSICSSIQVPLDPQQSYVHVGLSTDILSCVHSRTTKEVHCPNLGAKSAELSLNALWDLGVLRLGKGNCSSGCDSCMHLRRNMDEFHPVTEAVKKLSRCQTSLDAGIQSDIYDCDRTVDTRPFVRAVDLRSRRSFAHGDPTSHNVYEQHALWPRSRLGRDWPVDREASQRGKHFLGLRNHQVFQRG